MTATDYDQFAEAYAKENESGLRLPHRHDQRTTALPGHSCRAAPTRHGVRSFMCFLFFVLEAV